MRNENPSLVIHRLPTWRPNWTFSPWQPDRGGLLPPPGPVFQTLAEPGVISGPDATAWQIRIRHRHQSPLAFRVFGHGLFIEDHSETPSFAYSPAPRLLVGCLQPGLDVSLESNLDLHVSELLHCVTGEAATTYLVFQRETNRTLFCLFQTSLPRGEAIPEARAQMEGCSIADLAPWFANRTRLIARGRGEASHITAALHAAERLASQPRDAITDTANAEFLIPAWLRLDRHAAEGLMHHLCADQPDQPPLPPDLPLVQLAFALWHAGSTPQTLRRWFPALIRHVENTHRKIDSEGICRWSQPEQSLAPAMWTPEGDATDTLAFVIAETGCLFRIAREAIPRANHPPQPLADQLTALRERLDQQGWSSELNAYQLTPTNNDTQRARVTVAAISPLMDPDLPAARRARLLVTAGDPALLFTDHGLRSWVPWPSDDQDPEWSPRIQQRFLLATSFAPEDRTFHEKLRTSLATTLDEPLTLPHACLRLQTSIKSITATETRRSEVGMSEWLNHFRIRIAIGVGLLALLGAISTYVFVTTRTSLTPGALESMIARAKLLADDGHEDMAMDILEDIEQRGQVRTSKIYFRMGNIRYKQGRFDEALALYQREMDETPAPYVQLLMNRALTLYRLGNYEEAVTAYRSIVDEYQQTLPSLAMNAGIAGEISEKRRLDAEDNATQNLPGAK